MSAMQQHLYVVVDDWERGYSVHKFDEDDFGPDLNAVGGMDTARPVVRMEALHPHSWSFDAHGRKILANGDAAPGVQPRHPRVRHRDDGDGGVAPPTTSTAGRAPSPSTWSATSGPTSASGSCRSKARRTTTASRTPGSGSASTSKGPGASAAATSRPPTAPVAVAEGRPACPPGSSGGTCCSRNGHPPTSGRHARVHGRLQILHG
jgi:hypothetical protein